MRSLRFNPEAPSFSLYRHSPPASPSPPPEESIFIKEAESLIQKWNPDTSSYAKVTSLFYEDKTEAMNYIQCVHQLHKNMHVLFSQNPFSDKLIHAQNLMQIAMKRLQKEFYQILSVNRAHLDPESVSTARSSRTSVSSISSYNDDGVGTPEEDVRAAADSITEVERVSAISMADLRSIADCMISCGYGKECIRNYKIIRKSIIDDGIYSLNLEKLSSKRVKKMDWEVIELKIKNWLEAVMVSVRTLFRGERILCDHVFGASDSIRESCFAEISKDGAAIVFGFPELVAKTKKSQPEKIFRLLDMYSAVAALLPEIESIFSFNSTAVVRSQSLTSFLRLTESVRTILSEFESGIQKDSSNSSPSYGGVHPLTIQSMNHLSILADYSDVLSGIFAEWPPPETYLYGPESSDTAAPGFTVRIAWLIFVLFCVIDGKSRLCKDVSLSYLFLANNLNHVVAKVRTSNLSHVLGDHWMVKHEEKVKRLVTNYMRVAWGEVIKSLPENPKAVISPEEARVVFGKFNLEFEKAYRNQNSFFVPETEFREEIKSCIARNIVPVYREVYNTRRKTVESVRDMREYVTFTPEDVENYLENLFYVGK